MSGQLADERGDLVPRFASDDQFTVLNLIRAEIQFRRGSTYRYREFGSAGRRVRAAGSTVYRLNCNSSTVQLLSNVSGDFKLA